MYTKMENIRRHDFESYCCNSDGEPVIKTGDVSVIYNTDVISEKEVDELIRTGMYEFDSRVVVTTPERADNMKGPTRPIINMYRYSGTDVNGSVFAQSEENAWEILKEQLSSQIYNKIHDIELIVENVKNGIIMNGGVQV